MKFLLNQAFKDYWGKLFGKLIKEKSIKKF